MADATSTENEAAAVADAPVEAVEPFSGPTDSLTGAPGVDLDSPDVINPAGKTLIRLSQWDLTAFVTHVTVKGEDDPVEVRVTKAGVQVTKDQATELKASAVAHGVEVTEEKI